jgi:DNA-binding transcriptional MerR regulator
MKTLVDMPSNEAASRFTSIEMAADLLGVSYPSIRLYVKQFGLTSFKFPLDRRVFLKNEDVEKIKAWREAAQQRDSARKP